MARQAGPNYFIGKIGNLIYYKRNDVYLVKEANSSSKKLSKKEKEIRSLREGNIEFGGGAALSKAFRDTFASVVEPYNDHGLAGKLTGIFRSIIKKGSGIEGMRKAEIRKNKHLIEGFQFHKRNVFEQIFKPVLTWKINKDRKEITLTVPKFAIKGNVSKPRGASHYKITMVAGILSDYTYLKGKKKYVPLNVSINGKSFVVPSDYYPLKGSVKEIHISINLTSKIPDTCAIVICTGIQFYKEEGSEMYELETNKALEISRIF